MGNALETDDSVTTAARLAVKSLVLDLIRNGSAEAIERGAIYFEAMNVPNSIALAKTLRRVAARKQKLQ